ncbi:hypothetical protein Pedsa_2634 [Pseudopedobacter saltans DSM 12145]|uniref:GLUG domain-containing protein n=1 Tax=Pseudopedobacter saltans (strain ATCC 51119 / DSM 12145 / JCM 21818 / CCUG 39354 / LMG 10337 / NBRC 100064 / NCIMB 13643) TaxID=762903 RepID=F0S662_PSESL|nr:GLUG motif-containing protein [Pseudopedobacter saltans]ADY53176.1 hypothetical protein Pedsa_2634 [Pseudopedobacter saltans DSM 12145]
MKSISFIKNFPVLALLLLVLIGSCKKDNDRYYSVSDGRFQIYSEKSRITGNVVENMSLTEANKFNMVFVNPPKNNEAIVSAEEVNGVYIEEQKILLTGTAVDVPIKGKPKYEGVFTMIIKVKIDGESYVLNTKLFVDKPNVSAITLDLSEDVLYNAVGEVSRTFTVYPRSTEFEITASAGLTASIENGADDDHKVLKLLATDEFVMGDVVIKAKFLQVPEVVKTIKVVAFSNGDGTTSKPYEISDFARLNKVRYGLAYNYKLSSDIAGAGFSPISGVFTGTLDGNTKKISGLTFNNATTDNVALFNELGTSATVKNVEFVNAAITAQNNVALVAVTNRGTIDNIKASGTVKGKQYVAGVAVNNFGKVTNGDVTALAVSGDNYVATLAAKENTGSVQTNNTILNIPNTFPAIVYGINTVTTTTFSFSPSDAIIEVKSAPANLTATPIAGQKVTFTPATGFISGDVLLNLKKGNVVIAKTIKVYAKQEGSAFDGGDGTIGNPYLISSEDGLIAIAQGMDKNYKVVTDFALTKPWVPITNFSGTLDGSGHKITGLTINSTTANEGLFATVTGTIKNIQLLNVNCNATLAFGTLAGKLVGGTIQNVKITGDVTSTNGGDILGGVVGEMSAVARLTQVYTNLNIKAACGMVGGLVGRLTTASSGISEISNSTATGTIEISGSKNRIAGILGRAEGTNIGGGIIKNCKSSVNISATTAIIATVNGVGGIFGADQNAGIVPIDQCMFDGTISCGFSVGGIAGVGSSITNCLVEGAGAGQTTTATIRAVGTPATGNIGGIAGTNKVKLENCVVKNATLRASITTAAMPVAGLSSTYQNSGYSANSFVVSTSLEGSNTVPNANSVFRISGTAANGTGANKKNYVGSGVVTPFRDVPFVEDAAGLDGLTATVTNQAFFESTLGFDFSIWKIGTDGYPTLRNVGYNGTY